MTRLLDVTLREAGMINGFAFSLDQVDAIVGALDVAGLDVIEVGYFRPLQSCRSGGSCGHEYLNRVGAARRRAAVSVMVHPRDVPTGSYAPLSRSGVKIVRFALASRDIDLLPEHAEAVHGAGMRCTVNIIRATQVGEPTLLRMAEQAQQAGADCVYVADSNGSMYPDAVANLLDRVRARVDIPLGFHAHDNLRLAFANTLVALSRGAAWIDSSLGGAGKNGNLITELIAGHLNARSGRVFDLLTLARAFARDVAPTVPAQPQAEFCASVCGFLDLNLDRIEELKRESQQTHVPLEELLLRVHFAHSASAPDR